VQDRERVISLFQYYCPRCVEFIPLFHPVATASTIFFESTEILFRVLNTDLSTYAKEDFKADKNSLWQHPTVNDGWYGAHNSIRAELTKMMVVLSKLGAAPLVSWQVSCLQKYWKGHEEHVHGHYQNEDDIMNSFLRERMHYPDKLETDHTSLIELMDAIRPLIAALKPSSTCEELTAKWAEYKSLMEPHLTEEEQMPLPLLRTFFHSERSIRSSSENSKKNLALMKWAHSTTTLVLIANLT
jgi:hemerythrin-like domain-containing protein